MEREEVRQKQSRRDEHREETLAEIKSRAWQQMREQGADKLSLRQIMREMRMSSAALFRYFANREALLDALSQDAFKEINETLERATVEEGGSAALQLINLSLAYRQWALAHPEKFALIYGSSIPDYQRDWQQLVPEASHGLVRILSLLQAAFTTGELQHCLKFTDEQATLRENLQALCSQRGYNTTPEVLYLAIISWSRLHGLVILEVFGHLNPLISDTEGLYRYEVSRLLTEFELTKA